MAYPSSSQSYYSPQQQGGHDAYAQQFGRSDMGARERLQYLRIVVAVLGAASYLFSYGPMLGGHGGVEWAVRFALFAGLLAAFGFPAEQTRKAVAALAVVGFFDALALLINSTLAPGWALWVVISLNGLQALAAVGTLVGQPGTAAAERAAASAYEAYAGYYAQAQQYYGNQPAQAESPRQEAAARATAHGYQQAPVRQSHQPAASSYSSYGDYSDYSTEHATRSPQAAQQSANYGAQAGLPNFGQAQDAVAARDAEAGQVSRPTAQQ